MPEVNTTPSAPNDAYQFLLTHLTRATKDEFLPLEVRLFAGETLIEWVDRVNKEKPKPIICDACQCSEREHKGLM